MHSKQFYIKGNWRERSSLPERVILNPATEEQITSIALGSTADINEAVVAARAAFPAWAARPLAERLDYLRRLAAIYERRSAEMAVAISAEMGAPVTLAKTAQAPSGLSHLKQFLSEAPRLELEQAYRPDQPTDRIVREPIGVCGLITPWNWPMNQVCLKVPAALLVGCTVVLKPSEDAPLSSLLFAEFVAEAGFPPGVFNLVNGEGAVAGAALCAHPDVDMISFTGSSRAGAAISAAAAPTFKRVALELGGKSPNLIFADTDVEAAAKRGARSVFTNTGQSCDAPTRMLVERSVYARAVAAAAEQARETVVGDPSVEGAHIGPVSSRRQYETVQRYLDAGTREGARLVAGGPGRAPGRERGWFVAPTVFADVRPEMQVYREEIFGPVLTITPFESEAEAIRLANDTVYGLAAYVQSGDAERCRRVALQLRAGVVRLNGASRGPGCPFGGYKHSGLGREGGRFGLEEFLEIKAVSGWPVAS
ncbi:MAG: aldehyde dehydrogenase family protein [Proteobacteria bacterium]|nr:aldehyde dehydrogenase family protein [Pseudomonadota bacterium]